MRRILLAALARSVASDVTVLRGGQQRRIDAVTLVPGDVAAETSGTVTFAWSGHQQTVPVTVQQATLMQLDQSVSLPIAAPQKALSA